MNMSKGLKRQIAGSGTMDMLDLATFVPVKAGTFLMGSPLYERGRNDNEFQHKVTLTQDFEIQTTEVTQLQYLLVMGVSVRPVLRQNCSGDYQVVYGEAICSDHPVGGVPWYDVQDFISELNKGEDGYTYGLPTEAQWEYAARGCVGSGEPKDMALCTTTAFNLGDNISKDQVNYDRKYPYYGGPDRGGLRASVKVTSLPNVNDLGLYDMHGNVHEWVADRYGEYSESHVVDPKGPSSGPYRVLRGGGFISKAQNVRSASRFAEGMYSYSTRTSGFRADVGFRLVRTAKRKRYD